MSVVHNGGTGESRVMTTRGLRKPRPPECTVCRLRKEGQLYTVNPNGQLVCADCSGTYGEGVLRQECCDGDSCPCGVKRDEPDPA